MDVLLLFFFFFQAEDGIRDVAVTGVQTCALPISQTHPPAVPLSPANPRITAAESSALLRPGYSTDNVPRSEERRVGKGVDLGGRRIIKKKKKKKVKQ